MKLKTIDEIIDKIEEVIENQGVMGLSIRESGECGDEYYSIDISPNKKFREKVRKILVEGLTGDRKG